MYNCRNYNNAVLKWWSIPKSLESVDSIESASSKLNRSEHFVINEQKWTCYFPVNNCAHINRLNYGRIIVPGRSKSVRHKLFVTFSDMAVIPIWVLDTDTEGSTLSRTSSQKGIVRFCSRRKAPPYGEIHWPPPCCMTRTRLPFGLIVPPLLYIIDVYHWDT